MESLLINTNEDPPLVSTSTYKPKVVDQKKEEVSLADNDRIEEEKPSDNIAALNNEELDELIQQK